MIIYEEEWICSVICHYNGSVAIRASLYGLVSSVLCIVVHVFHDQVEGFLEELGIGSLTASQAWTAATAVLAVLLGFRTQQAFKRFWEGTSLLHQMRGEWFDSVSCLVAFSRGAIASKPKEVQHFRHTIVRLMSLCHGSALEEIADTDHLVAIDTLGLDHGTLRHLKECKQEYGFNRVECLLHLFQALVTKGLDDGILPIAPPILSRVYQTLSRGFVNLLNAKKITDTRFPFPYAQLIVQLLFLSMFLTPLLMATLIKGSMLFSTIITFVHVSGTFSLNFAASELENPFGSDDNDLPLVHFQTEMNSSLLMLLHARTDHVSSLSDTCLRDFELLKSTGLGHRRHSICSLNEWSEEKQEEELASDGQAAGSNEEAAKSDSQAAKAPVVLPSTRIALEELEPKIALLAKRVEEFGLSLPQWTQMIETQVLELGRSFSALQDLVDSDKVEWQGELDDAAAVSLQCFPAL